LEVFIPDGDIIFSQRVGFNNPKKVERTHIAVDEAALKAGSHHGATYYQLEAFLKALAGKGPVVVSAEDGLRAVAIGVAAEISAREKRAVTMTELGF
jgi:predicted dehydrogenase